jgi:hypothetical protein
MGYTPILSMDRTRGGQTSDPTAAGWSQTVTNPTSNLFRFVNSIDGPNILSLLVWGASMSSGKSCHKRLALSRLLLIQVLPFMGMAAPLLGRAERSSPKARRVATRHLAARGLDGDGARQAIIGVAT